jgi:hypothetical protein
MRLEGNIGFFDKVSDILYWKECNVLNSDDNIRYKQKIDISTLIESNYLTYNIYNEVNRK